MVSALARPAFVERARSIREGQVNSLSFAVPNNPVLVGASIYAQGLLTQSPAPAFLTNVSADVINP